MVIRDTTADGIEDWVEPELRVPVAQQAQRAEVEEMEDVQQDGEAEENDMDEDGDDSDVEIQSVGIELNERLRAAVAQREAGNAATVMDEEWEQWLKDAVEAGGIPFLSSDLGLSPNANIPGTRPATETPAMHPRLLNAARLGQWQQIPDFLHNMVRQNIENNNRRMEDSTPSVPQEAASSSSNNTSSPFLSRSNRSPRARTVPPSSSSASSFGRVDPRTVSRLDNHFADQFSRRPIPPLPASTVPGVGGATSTTRSSVRLGLARSTQQGNGS